MRNRAFLMACLAGSFAFNQAPAAQGTRAHLLRRSSQPAVSGLPRASAGLEQTSGALLAERVRAAAVFGAGGGVLHLAFDEPVVLLELVLVDVDGSGAATVQVLDGASLALAQDGVGDGASRLRIAFRGSAGLAEASFVRPVGDLGHDIRPTRGSGGMGSFDSPSVASTDLGGGPEAPVPPVGDLGHDIRPTRGLENTDATGLDGSSGMALPLGTVAPVRSGSNLGTFSSPSGSSTDLPGARVAPIRSTGNLGTFDSSGSSSTDLPGERVVPVRSGTGLGTFGIASDASMDVPAAPAVPVRSGSNLGTFGSPGGASTDLPEEPTAPVRSGSVGFFDLLRGFIWPAG